jgi:hypothetical protein
VERDIDRTARGAVPADGRRHRPRGGVDPCDIEVRLADRLQHAAPVNRAIVDLVRKAEAGAKPLGPAALRKAVLGS